MAGMCKTHGGVMKFRLAHRPYVILSKAEPFEKIMSSNKHITKGPDYRFMWPWLGDGLLTSKGQKWHSRRKMLTPAFHFKILEDFLIVMNEQSKIMKNKLSKIPKVKSSEDTFGRKRRLAFLDLLLEVSDHGKVLSDEEIREEVDTFMFEGHDTTAANMTFTCYLLALHPEVQKKVQDELDSIFHDDHDRDCTMDDLAEMKYLESVIKESLRLFPSVPFMTRTLTEDVELSGMTVPTGTHIFLFNYLLHRDPDQFPNPEEFDPDRFADSESVRKRHPYAYVPFSAGPRNCIGQKFAMMEEKVELSSIMRNFTLKTSLQRKDLKLLPEIILRPKAGIPVTLEPRVK